MSGCIVTLDALGCQKKIDREMTEADADYVLALTGNQEKVHEEVQSSWLPPCKKRNARGPKGR